MTFNLYLDNAVPGNSHWSTFDCKFGATVCSLYLDVLYLDIFPYVDGLLTPFRLHRFCLSTSRYPLYLDISLSR